MNVSTAQKPVHNQDRIFAYSVSDGKHAFYDVLVVCDGHGGDEAVTAVRTHIRDLVDHELATRPANMAASLCSIFDHLQALVHGLMSGTTCTLCIVVDKTTVWCANVGDSHALLVEPLSSTWLSVSHRLDDNPEERTAAAGRGASLYRASGGALRGSPGGLSMSRGLGDVDCTWITHAPSVSMTTITDSCFTIILATDGVWDAIPREKITKKIQQGLFRGDVAAQLVELAWRRRQSDDVSAIVACHGMCAKRSSPLTRLLGSSSSMSSEDDIVLTVPLGDDV